MRKTPNGGSVRHLSQLERCLVASGGLILAASIPQKRQFRSLVHAKIRHNFLSKNPDRSILCLLSVQSPCHCPGRRCPHVGKHGTDPMSRPNAASEWANGCQNPSNSTQNPYNSPYGQGPFSFLCCIFAKQSCSGLATFYTMVGPTGQHHAPRWAHGTISH